MTRLVVPVTCALIMMPLVGATSQASEGKPNAEELRAAHEALREAVEKIRVYHEGQEGMRTFYVSHDDAIAADSRRPRLGVVVETGSEGARVVAVTPSGPADEAGLRTGDVITEVDGRPLTGGPESPTALLVDAIADLEEGRSVIIGYLRNGEQGTANVAVRPVDMDVHILKGRPYATELRMMPGDGKIAWFFPDGWRDMELVALNPDLADYFGTDEGVLVIRAPANGELGLEGGDVIVSIDDRVVRNPTHAMRILRSYEPGEHVVIEIMRHGHRETIESTVPEQQVDLMHPDIGYRYEYRWPEEEGE